MSDKNQHVDEGMIHAWLDGALSPDESARIEAHTTTCAECSALVAEARGLIAASSRILASLDAVPAGVIPGHDAGADQLAALRARRQASTRRWWSDRRVLAAASLVLVAGLSSVVWRQSADVRSASDATAGPSTDSAPIVVPSAVSQPSNAPAEFSTRPAVTDAVAPTSPPVAAAPAPVAAGRAADSMSDMKVAASVGAARARTASPAANEARVDSASRAETRQAVDAVQGLARDQAAAPQRQAQQQAPAQQQLAGASRPDSVRFAPLPRLSEVVTTSAASPPPPQAKVEQQQRVDSSRVAGTGAAETRTRAAAVGFGVGARILDPASPAGGCYALSELPPGNTGLLAARDTVVLLDMTVSEPGWFLARPARGMSSSVMHWRQVDSVTVELRTRTDRRTTVERFLIVPREVRQDGRTTVRGVPDVRGLPDVIAKWSLKVPCP